MYGQTSTLEEEESGADQPNDEEVPLMEQQPDSGPLTMTNGESGATESKHGDEGVNGAEPSADVGPGESNSGAADRDEDEESPSDAFDRYDEDKDGFLNEAEYKVSTGVASSI